MFVALADDDENVPKLGGTQRYINFKHSEEEITALKALRDILRVSLLNFFYNQC
jgi:hypothetical protein